MLEDPDFRIACLEQNILPKLVERMTDDSLAIVCYASIGLSRLLVDSATGDACCHRLCAVNFLPLLEGVLARVLDVIQAKMKHIESETTVLTEVELQLLERIVEISAVFCEVSRDMLHRVVDTAPTLAPLLSALLELADRLPIAIVHSAGNCLLNLVEEYQIGVSRCCSMSHTIELLHALAHGRELYLSVLAVSILQRIWYSRAIQHPLFSHVTVLADLMLKTLHNALNVSSYDQSAEQDRSVQWRRSLDTCEVGLDTLADMILPSHTSCMVQKDRDNDTDMVDMNVFWSDMRKRILTEFIAPVLHLANMQTSINSTVNAQQFGLICTLSLDFLQDLAWIMAESEIETSVLWHNLVPELWIWITSNLSKFLVYDEQITTSITSLLYALSKNPNAASALTTSQLNSFYKLYHSSLDADIQVKIVGVLGALANNSRNIEHNRSIGTFLITIVLSLPRSDPDAAIESLNALFDIYADGESAYDGSVFVQGHFLAHLRDSLPKVKAMKRTIDRRTSRALWSRADEVVENLENFIEYKQGEASQR